VTCVTEWLLGFQEWLLSGKLEAGLLLVESNKSGVIVVMFKRYFMEA
jgi:hypothetical protein